VTQKEGYPGLVQNGGLTTCCCSSSHARTPKPRQVLVGGQLAPDVADQGRSPSAAHRLLTARARKLWTVTRPARRRPSAVEFDNGGGPLKDIRVIDMTSSWSDRWSR